MWSKKNFSILNRRWWLQSPSRPSFVSCHHPISKSVLLLLPNNFRGLINRKFPNVACFVDLWSILSFRVNTSNVFKMEEGLLLCVTGIQFVNLKYFTTDIGRPLYRKGRFSWLKSLFTDFRELNSKSPHVYLLLTFFYPKSMSVIFFYIIYSLVLNGDCIQSILPSKKSNWR